MSDRTTVAVFRLFAFAEAFSWAGLLIGMYLKYVPETTETVVHVFGPLHGGLFLAYLLAAAYSSRRFAWTARSTLLALAAGVPPFTTVAFEAWARRSGLFDRR